MPQAPKSLLHWIRQLSGYLVLPTAFFLALMASDRWRHPQRRADGLAGHAELPGPPPAKIGGQGSTGQHFANSPPPGTPSTDGAGEGGQRSAEGAEGADEGRRETSEAVGASVPPAAPSQPASLASALPGSGSADELLRLSVDKSEQVSALTAKVRCVGTLFAIRLELEGRYWQLNRGGRTQVRYELTRLAPNSTAGAPSRVLQISDGRFLWEIAEQGTKRSVGRTDLRQLQEHAWSDKLAALRLGTGGIPKMLTSLRRDLDWDSPVAAELDGIAVWRLSGRWTKHRAVMVSQGQPDQVEKWPPHIPDRIEVMLGRDDLVPYRIDFRRSGGSLMVCELFEVATPAVLDEDLFRWLNAEPQIEDRTESLRSSIEAAQKP